MASRRRLSNCGLAGEATSHFAFTALPSIAVGEKEEVEQIFGPGGAIEAFEVADPGYLSFEKLVLPVAIERGMGIHGMKSLANAKLL